MWSRRSATRPVSRGLSASPSSARWKIWLISHLDIITRVRFVVWLLLGLALYFGFSYRNSKLNNAIN
ncbi:amino acid permease C-terminal domain-containing protein [Nocardia acidivorans]|uniref:amino acid permease C-terminal domain-containing protein n=1 Tax=Nocardia acidivorans TaxID=404580 RepID=UPI001FE15FCC|nr:amino acid permease C-terminal domain-containing protein [Nocardia acidivorans]